MEDLASKTNLKAYGLYSLLCLLLCLVEPCDFNDSSNIWRVTIVCPFPLNRVFQLCVYP